MPASIAGHVTAAGSTTKPIVVVLLRESRRGDAEFDAYWVLHRPGPFAFLRPPGTYYLFAFEDRNGDLAFQPDEPAGWHGTPVRAPARARLEGVDVALQPGANGLAALRRLDALGAVDVRSRTKQRHAGDVAGLSDPRFSAEAGKLGLWNPSRFLERFGAGIYFLEPYDPSKIPVLFVHGASGFPQEWSYLVSRLDRSRFQPWVFHYPSGLGLQESSDVLTDVLDELRSDLRCPSVIVVAHSMGGLVARTAIQRRAGGGAGLVGLFVTISTPWQGHTAAGLGVRHSPVVIPSWNDMAPGSAFLTALRATPLPPDVAYHLFFGYRGGETLVLRENSDRSVTMQSMLDPAAQEEAVRIHGYHEDHQSILTSADVSRTLNQLVDDEARRVRRGDPRAGR